MVLKLSLYHSKAWVNKANSPNTQTHLQNNMFSKSESHCPDELQKKKKCYLVLFPIPQHFLKSDWLLVTWLFQLNLHFCVQLIDFTTKKG